MSLITSNKVTQIYTQLNEEQKMKKKIKEEQVGKYKKENRLLEETVKQ